MPRPEGSITTTCLLISSPVCTAVVAHLVSRASVAIAPSRFIMAALESSIVAFVCVASAKASERASEVSESSTPRMVISSWIAHSSATPISPFTKIPVNSLPRNCVLTAPFLIVILSFTSVFLSQRCSTCGAFDFILPLPSTHQFYPPKKEMTTPVRPADGS
ncbi:hypothetical protein ES705_45754 [subsurface metagenome]